MIKKLKRFYNYLFCTIYKWHLYLNKNQKMALTQAMLQLIFFYVALTNLFIGIMDDFYSYKISSPFSKISYAIIYVLLIYILHYYFYERKQNYERIYNRFLSIKESKTTSYIRKGLIFVIINGIILMYVFYFSIFE